MPLVEERQERLRGVAVGVVAGVPGEGEEAPGPLGLVVRPVERPGQRRGAVGGRVGEVPEEREDDVAAPFLLDVRPVEREERVDRARRVAIVEEEQAGEPGARPVGGAALEEQQRRHHGQCALVVLGVDEEREDADGVATRAWCGRSRGRRRWCVRPPNDECQKSGSNVSTASPLVAAHAEVGGDDPGVALLRVGVVAEERENPLGSCSRVPRRGTRGPTASGAVRRRGAGCRRRAAGRSGRRSSRS